MTRNRAPQDTTGAQDLLPDELLWADGGHASDVVLTALADGQLDIVPALVRAHVDGCRACTTHLGNAALLSLHAGREMALVARDAREVEQAVARAKLPRLAIVLGLAFAALGLVPSLALGRSGLGARGFGLHDVLVLANGFGTLVRRLHEPGSPTSLALTYGAALSLVLMALALVRLLPKKEVSR